MLCYDFLGVWPKDHGPGCSAKVSRGKYTVPQPLLHHVGLDELPCQIPLLRARHTTYSIPN
jgi:hypothetical protein